MIPHCIAFVACALLVFGSNSSAFSPASSLISCGYTIWSGVRHPINASFVLMAKGPGKKRRRRKDEENSFSPAPVDDGDLPDFDLDDTLPPTEGSKPPDGGLGNLSISGGENDPGLMEAMRGSATTMGAGSPRDILSFRDRSLEATFEFDEVESPLPRLERKKNANTAYDVPPAGMGKKRSRDEARKAAAIQSAQESQKEEGFLSSLPFVGNKGEKLSPLKVRKSVPHSSRLRW